MAEGAGHATPLRSGFSSLRQRFAHRVAHLVERGLRAGDILDAVEQHEVVDRAVVAHRGRFIAQ